ncbi:MAG: magnesium transporter [Gammaproteobacteria bacterium]|jgi:magnesium transporter|nr:magnesium transporter [Gammaproteobacteria bacterium]
MPTQKSEQQTNYQEMLHKALEEGARQTVTELIKGLHPAEIADVLEALPRELRPELWHELPDATRGEVLLEAHGQVRKHLIEASDKEELLAALDTLEMDELADLDAVLPKSVVHAMKQGMDVDQRDRYEAVRSYPDDTAGGLMDIDAASVRADVNLKAVLRYLRRLRSREGELPEHLDSIMVVDDDNTYLGILRLSDVVSLDSETPVSEAMTTGVPAIPVLTPATNVARLFEDRDLISAAVISDSGRLLGRITIDDVVDVMRKEAEHEVMSRAGLTKATDMFGPLIPSVSRRAIWLGVNLVNAFIAAWVIGLFEQSIDKMVALAILMPVVASMGGVAGNQTLTLVTRGIALGQIGRSNARHLLFRELILSLLNGILWALVVAFVVVLWFDNLQLGIVFGSALIINLLMGALAGTLMPLILQRLSIDPALAGGVLLIAATDVVGFMSFLGLATLFLL